MRFFDNMYSEDKMLCVVIVGILVFMFGCAVVDTIEKYINKKYQSESKQVINGE